MSVIPEEINKKLKALPKDATNKIVDAINNSSQTLLDLSFCNLQAKDVVVIADLLNSFPRITTLDVDSNNFGAEGATALASNQTITTLYVGANNIGDKGAIALASNQTIITLYVGTNNIGAEGARALAGNQTITTLKVGFNNIGDKGARALAGNQTITTLDVGLNNIGEEGARALAGNQTIATLNVGMNNIDAEAMALINAMLRINKEEASAKKHFSNHNPARSSLSWLAAKEVAKSTPKDDLEILPDELQDAVREARKYI